MERSSVRTDTARRQSCVTDGKGGEGRETHIEVVARALRRLVFATGVLLGLAFAVACYAEMFGVIQFD
jgi:hypothetical protein